MNTKQHKLFDAKEERELFKKRERAKEFKKETSELSDAHWMAQLQREINQRFYKEWKAEQLARMAKREKEESQCQRHLVSTDTMRGIKSGTGTLIRNL